MTTSTFLIIAVLSLLLILSIVGWVWTVIRLTDNIRELEESAQETSTMLDNLEEQIEKSLNMLDSCYRDIGKVLEMPVFFDDPVVKHTLNSIKRSQDAVLRVANKITNSFSSVSESDRSGNEGRPEK